MRALAVMATLLMTVWCANAGFAGFQVGNGVALTGGVVRVNYMGNKSHSFLLGRLRVSLMEVQITFANGKTKRQTMFFAGTHALRAPLPIEVVEVLGPVGVVALLCGLSIMLN